MGGQSVVHALALTVIRLSLKSKNLSSRKIQMTFRHLPRNYHMCCIPSATNPPLVLSSAPSQPLPLPLAPSWFVNLPTSHSQTSLYSSRQLSSPSALNLTLAELHIRRPCSTLRNPSASTLRALGYYERERVPIALRGSPGF